MIPNSHPSFLELDRCFLRGETEATPEVRRHLADCRRCAGYLQALRTASTSASIPEWATKIDAQVALHTAPIWPHERRAKSSRDRTRLRPWQLGGALVIAAAAAVLVFIMPRPTPLPHESQDSVRSKGAPMVSVYIKRDDRVWLWDGQDAVHPGDQLRLKISAEGYQHIAVAAPMSGSQQLRLLYSGALSSRQFLLPMSWVVDAQSDVEDLYVFLSRKTLPKALKIPSQGTSEADSIWTQRLLFHKAIPNGQK